MISPSGQGTITFTKDLITLTALPLDCTSSLVVNPSFVNPPGIPFDSAGTSVAAVPSYASIFLHTL